MEDEPELETSPLSQVVSDRGKTVDVQIYRCRDIDNASDTMGQHGWILEVVDEYGNSTVWDDEFPTDSAALDELKATIQTEGIESLIGINA